MDQSILGSTGIDYNKYFFQTMSKPHALLIQYLALSFWTATLAVSGEALAQIPRKDVLECAFADGSKIILESKYLWHPVVLYPHGDDRSDEEPLRVYYKRPASRKRVKLETTWTASRLSYRSDGSDDDYLISQCNTFKKVNGVLSSNPDLYRDRDGSHYILEQGPLSLTVTQQAEIARLGARLTEEVRVLDGTSIYQEHSVVARGKGTVVAAVQSESVDFGKTWKVLGITTSPRIFKVGKTEAQQNFVARPTRVNGKRFKPISQANKPLSCEPDNLSIECGRMVFECDGPNPSQECARFPKQ